MQIAGYLKTSLIEWPGKISSVIFTQGCNFRCGFCHNADLVSNTESTEKNRKHGEGRVEVKEVLADLTKRRKWVDGVAITGGEPTLQKDLPEFLGKLHDLGFLTMVETNGSRPEAIRGLIENRLVEYWTMDLKGDLDNYPQFAGMQKSPPRADRPLAEKIKTSMGLIAGSGVEYEFKTTVVPGIHTSENLVVLAKEIREVCEVGVPRVSRAPRVPRAKSTKHQVPNTKQISNYKYQITNTQYQVKWFLQQFRPTNCLDRSYLKKKGFTKEEMEGFLMEVKKIIPQTFLRGV